MTAGGHIAAGPGIGLLDGASGEDPLLLDQNRAGLIAALIVLPDPRGDVVDRIDNVWGMGDASILLSQRTGGGGAVRRLARRESGRLCQRVLMIANMLEGMEHEEAARLAGLSRSTAYEWHNRRSYGLDLDAIEDAEPDAALGNGGLGRLSPADVAHRGGHA